MIIQRHWLEVPDPDFPAFEKLLVVKAGLDRHHRAVKIPRLLATLAEVVVEPKDITVGEGHLQLWGLMLHLIRKPHYPMN